jgi:PhnB protein
MAKKVRTVPKGYQTVTPGIAVQGAAAFIAFCKKAFSAKELMRMPGPNGSVMHAEIVIGTSHLMVGDEMPGMNKSAKTLGGSPVNLYLYVDDCDAAFKKAVKAGATVRMPLENMFWGDRMGQVSDPFGHSWSISTHIEDVSNAEMKKRGKKWMAAMAGNKPQA